MGDFFTQSRALCYVAAIQRHLEPGATIGNGTLCESWKEALRSNANIYRVEGKLALRTHGESGAIRVPVRILVQPQWTDVPPTVFCEASFLRKEGDWHYQVRDDCLCHVLPEQWVWQLQQWIAQGLSTEVLVELASKWFCQNVDSLITRHLIGNRMGYKKWPKQWDQWSHAALGVVEFQKSLLQQEVSV